MLLTVLLAHASAGGRRGDTVAVHAGRDDLGPTSHVPLVDLSTTYPIPDLAVASASMDSLGAGGPPAGSSMYQRLHNPTVQHFEAAIAALEGTDDAVAFASGMAAITACVMACATQDKRHVVGVRPIYGGTDSLLSKGLLNVEVTWTDADHVAESIRDDTVCVLCESPANPTCSIVDLAAICEQAGEVPVIADSTFATPVLQQPARQGAAMVVHSCTKNIGGHGDVLGGVVAAGADWAKRVRRVRGLTGSNLHPMAAYELHRGLQTLPVRVRAAQATATEIAKRLEEHPAVSSVHFPTAESHPELIGPGKQMAGPGTVMSFNLAGGYEAAKRLMSRVRLITPAVSLGTTDTLIQHPAGITHRSMSDDDKESAGISASLIRLSIGLEDVDDIWEDLDQALAAA